VTFRTRLLLVFTLAVVAAVGLVEALVQHSTRQAFESVEAQRVDGLVAQFQKEFDRRKQEIVRAVNGIARSEALRTIATSADYAPYYDAAQDLASAHGLKATGTGGRRWHADFLRRVARAVRLQRGVADPRRGLAEFWARS